MQTTACWWTLPESLGEGMEKEEFKNAMVGLAHLMRHIAPLYLMCAPQDICVSYHVKDTFTDKPTIYLYDNISGGIGLSDKIYEPGPQLFDEAYDMLKACPCISGCPSCGGANAGFGAKQTLMTVLRRMKGQGK